MQALPHPAQHSDGLDHGDGDRVVGPDAPVQQADIMPCDVLPEVGRGGRGRQRCVYGKGPKIRPESRMMRGLVDVDGSRHRVPRGYHQTGLGMADASVTQDILERILQRIGIILVAVEPADAAQLSTQEIAQHIPVLAEDLRPPVLVKSEYLRGRMPQRQGDANNPSRRGAGNHVEIRSDRLIEVLFQFRQEGRRGGAQDAAPSIHRKRRFLCPDPSSSPIISASSCLRQPVPPSSFETVPTIPYRTAPARGRYRFVLAPSNAPTVRPQVSGTSAHPAHGWTVVGSLRRPRCFNTYRRAGTRPEPHL